jgi:hypothetical protein
MDEAARRLQELHAWQLFYNMEPRSDSALTDRYVRGEVPWTVDVVARELMATDHIYKTTLYGETIEEYMRALAHGLKTRHGLTWTRTWEIVRFYGPISLKLLMLLSCSTCIPERLE